MFDILKFKVEAVKIFGQHSKTTSTLTAKYFNATK